MRSGGSYALDVEVGLLRNPVPHTAAAGPTLLSFLPQLVTSCLQKLTDIGSFPMGAEEDGSVSSPCVGQGLWL